MNKKMLLISLCMLLVSCEQETPLEEPDWDEIHARQEWRDTHKYLNHTINHPEQLNCSTIAWIIESQAYPPEISWVYHCTEYQGNKTDWCETHTTPHTKQIYDDHFWRYCLTEIHRK